MNRFLEIILPLVAIIVIIIAFAIYKFVNSDVMKTIETNIIVNETDVTNNMDDTDEIVEENDVVNTITNNTINNVTNTTSNTVTNTVTNTIANTIVESEKGNVSERIQSKVKFEKNECIAVGYVTDKNESKFADKYFSKETYKELAQYDFRETVNKKDNYGNKFVIIPINGEVEISVHKCHVDEKGNVIKDNAVIKNTSEPFIMLNDYIEYIPKICVSFKYNGNEDTFPITFSGEDGSLDLTRTRN